MPGNKNHWYDGWFYDKFIAPNQDKLFGQIKDIIEPDSRVVDIGCGTGRLAFTIADNCQSVLGIDLSKKNISMAQLKLIQMPDDRIVFKHGNLAESTSKEDPIFDYAILTYVIHEVDEPERVNLLIEAASISSKIIIGDYIFPRPSGFHGWMSKRIEYIAGKDHYRNYNSYMRNGGIYYLAKEAGLKIIYETNNQPSTNHIAVLVK